MTITAFPTVDEIAAFATRLAQEHPDRVTVREIGRSRAGTALQLLTVKASRSRHRVLVIGQPHPNEPIGMATIMALCERLLADTAALDATEAEWHFVPCADPDGTRLNEGWFRGPFTREHYARNYFRPGPEAQVEWTFPFHTDGYDVDAPLPETRALMAVIDEIRPTVLASLHNSEMGGAYFYATDDAEPLYAQLTDLCREQGIPLHLGEPEFPLSTVFAPAVYSVPTAQQMYELAVAMGIDPSAFVSGASSLDYTRQYTDPVGVVIEVPYWTDPRADDTSEDPQGRSRREVILRDLERQDASMARIRELYDATAPLPASLIADALESFLRLDSGGSEERRQEVDVDPDYARTATVAEVFSITDEHSSWRLRLLGMLGRALPTDSALASDVEQLLQQWSDEAQAESRAEAIPIDNLVAVQMGAILAAVAHAGATRPGAGAT
ncbi:MAG: hypothetical protein JJD92_00095 [Frankiaceae bacterium]|nr:hypothetical protein [Frankiaceae bacterium]